MTKKHGGDPSLFKRIKKFFKKPRNRSLEKCKDHSQYKDQKILTKSQKIRIKFVLNTETDDDHESETDESDELEIESTDELESPAIQDAELDSKLMQKTKSKLADKCVLEESNSDTIRKMNKGSEIEQKSQMNPLKQEQRKMVDKMTCKGCRTELEKTRLFIHLSEFDKDMKMKNLMHCTIQYLGTFMTKI